MELAPTIIIVVGAALALMLSAIAILALRSWRFMSFRSLRHDILDFLGMMGRVLIGVLLFACMLGLLGPIGAAWLILLFVLVEGSRKYWASQQYALLWLLTVSAERSMPLVPAIEAFARERGGKFGRRTKRLAAALNAGVPLPDALDRCPGLLPRCALPIVRVGCASDALAPALRQAATTYDLYESIWAAINGKIAYLLLLPAFGIAILTFIMFKIVPSFEKIFKDFGTTLPAMTQLLLRVSYFNVNYWFLFFPFYLLGLWLLVYVMMRYFSLTDVDLPGIARLVRRLDSAQILDILALVARQQRPLPEGIAALAQSYPKKDIRRRLRQAMADIAAGRDWCESLREQGLIRRPELALLQAAQRVGNLPWALTEMADSVRRRLAYRVQAAVQILFPPAVIVMGLVVMFIVVALFLPLISLIQKLA